jgi:hypothetical protein
MTWGIKVRRVLLSMTFVSVLALASGASWLSGSWLAGWVELIRW